MFQKKIVEKYIAKLDQEDLKRRYEVFSDLFLNADKQRNIRNSKEEQYQEGFIRDLFVAALGYTIKPDADYNIFTEAKNDVKNRSNSKKADAAICAQNDEANIKAVIELKGTDTTDLDKVAFQAFSYKNFHSDCKYVVVSNFERLRFYADVQSDFEEYNLFTLTFEQFKALYLLLGVESIKNDVPERIKSETLSEEKQITDEFYRNYSAFKRKLFDDIEKNNPGYDKVLLFKKTQKLLDRILFVCFSEDRGLLPPNSIRQLINSWEGSKGNAFSIQKPLYDYFKNYFHLIDTGFGSEKDENRIFAYNGGLFKGDETLDGIKIGDAVLFENTRILSGYDFSSQISVDILGRIFENSLTEIEEVERQLSGIEAGPAAVSKRKKDGVFYTPEYITKYIVENTIGRLCDEKKKDLRIDDEEFSSQRKYSKREIEELEGRLNGYRSYLFSLKILDCACGSGAFLNAALHELKKEHQTIDRLFGKIHGSALEFDYEAIVNDNSILENNLYGVDINEDSVEITKLSLWLHTAKKNRKLTTLNGRIKCGNSLIDDPAFEKAFDWRKEFPEVFAAGGFDVVIGNPPYVQLQSLGMMSDIYEKCGYESYNKGADLYCLFTERGFGLLKKDGLLSFIMPNKWMLVDYGRQLRKFMSKTSLQQIINFGDVQFFKDASTIVCIFVTKKSDQKNKVLACSLNQKTYKGNFNQEIKAGLEEFDFDNFGEEPWIINSQKETRILAKMRFGKPLKDYQISIYRGVLTGYNDAFFIDEATRKALIAEDPKSADLIKPLLRGRDIAAWKTSTKDQYLLCIFPSLKLDIEEYPAIKKHLLSFGKERLEQNGKNGSRKKTSNAWFETQDQILYYEEFAKPKIIYPEITAFQPFCYDDECYVTNNKAFIITSKDDSISLKVLTAIFNSKICKLWIWYNCPELLGGTREIRKAYFENFPIPSVDPERQKPLVELADTMLELNAAFQSKVARFISRIVENYGIKKASKGMEAFYRLEFADFVRELAKLKVRLTLRQQDDLEEYFGSYKADLVDLETRIKSTDASIDRLVYELYGLTDDEIRAVEEI